MTGRNGEGRAERLARWLLERCAPQDAEVALADLEEERRRGIGAWLGQLLLVCAWGLVDRFRGPGRAVRPLHALRMAARGVVRAPGTAVTAALILGVALTATVTLLGTFFGSFRPLPVPDGEDVVRVQVLDRQARPAAPTLRMVEAWRDEAGPLLGIGGIRSASMTAVVEGGGALRVSGAALSPEVLDFLGIPPVRGRLLRPGTEDLGSVLVREDVWEELGSPEPGATLRLDGTPRTLVGVMPRDFGFPTMHGLWTPLPDQELSSADEIVARLRPGTDPAMAAEVLGVVVAAGAADDAREDAPARVRVLGYVEARGEGGEGLAFGALGVLVAILLVVCTANASTLLLVRARERVDTLAIHAALGASRLQVVLQLLLESALVAGVGGLLGLVGGGLLLVWIQDALAVHWGYYWMRMEMQPSVIVATASVVVGCALIAGTLPALQALRTDLRIVMGSGGGRSGRVARSRGGRWFVGAQVLLSTAGLVIALILLDGFERGGDLLTQIPVEEVAFASLGVSDASPEDVRRLAATLREELAALPGVRAVSVSAEIPGWRSRVAPLRVEGAAPEEGQAGPPALWLGVDPGLRDIYELTLLQGRWLEESDGPGTERVAVVTRSFVDRHLPPGDPLGRGIRLGGVGPEAGDDGWIRIVGVVEDWVPGGELARRDRVLLPMVQTRTSELLLSVRSAGDPASQVPAIRDVVRRVDPDRVPDRAETLSSFFAYLTRMPRVMGAFGAGGGLAGVLVAAVGLFGILSFRVRSRLPAAGVRMALGARPERILREVLSEAARGVLPWIVAGLALGLLMAPATVIFSFGAPFRAPGTYLAAGLLMLVIVLAAALIPALRAARLDPLTVLRGE